MELKINRKKPLQLAAEAGHVADSSWTKELIACEQLIQLTSQAF